jgi:hypothetical protein
VEKQRWIVLPLLLRCKPPADALQHFPAVGAIVDDHELSHDLAAGVVYAWDPADGVIPPEVWVFALLDDAVLLLICAYTGEQHPAIAGSREATTSTATRRRAATLPAGNIVVVSVAIQKLSW